MLQRWSWLRHPPGTHTFCGSRSFCKERVAGCVRSVSSVVQARLLLSKVLFEQYLRSDC